MISSWQLTHRRPADGTPIAGAQLDIETVTDRGAPTLASATDAVLAGSARQVSDAAGRFAFGVYPSADRPWSYGLTITLPGESPRTVRLADMPDRDATIDELLPAPA